MRGSLVTTGEFCFTTGVNLPNRATLVSLTVFYRSDNQSNVDVRFHRHKLATGGDVHIVDQPHSDDSDVRTSVTFPISTATTVNNNGFAYGFGVCMGPGTIFFGAMIKYTFTSAGD